MRFVFVGPVVWSLAFAALAGDGVIEINQAKALAGGVTPCDLPGFPVEICDSGSYRLTSNLKYVSAVSSAIVMTAADVTLDLNGMTILGDNTCTTGSEGWVTSCTQSSGPPAVNGSFRIAVADGRIIGAAGPGVVLSDASEVRDLLVSDCAGGGVFVGSRSVATRISAIGNLGVGVGCFSGSCNLSWITATNNSLLGVAASGVVTQSVASSNGSTGFALYSGSQLSHFASNRNAGFGVTAQDGSIVSFGSIRDSGAANAGASYGLQLDGAAGYRGVVVTAAVGGNAATVVGGVNLGSNSCQGGACPP